VICLNVDLSYVQEIRHQTAVNESIYWSNSVR